MHESLIIGQPRLDFGFLQFDNQEKYLVDQNRLGKQV